MNIFALWGEIEINRKQVEDDLKAVEEQAESSGGKMADAFGKVTDIVKTLAGPAVLGAVVAGLVSIGKTGFENIKQVEDQMNLFRAATGATAEETERFGNTIKALHKVNTDSYEDISNAVTALRLRHGDLGDKMGEVTQQFMDFAKVTGQDSAQAIDTVSDLMVRFNIPLEEASGFMDTLMATSQETGIPIRELQSALDGAGTQLSAMGYSLEEAVAMLGAFHQQGVDAGTTQRALNAYMNNTREISDSQTEALSKLGVSLDIVYFASDKTAAKAKEFGIELSEGQRISEDMARELKGLGIEFDISAKLAGTQKEALAEMFETMASGEADVETMQAAIQIFGTRAGPEMLQALQSGAMGIEELMATLEGSEGVVAEASAVYDKQLGERWELIKRQYLEPFMETIGVALMNLLEYVLDKVEEWGPYIEAGFEFFQETIVPIFGVFVDVAQNAFGVVGGLIETLIGVFTGDWDRALQGVKDMWDSVWNGVVALLDGLGLVDAISNMWNSAMEFMRELPQKMIDMGVDIIDGLVTGIKNAVSRPIEAVKETASNILGTVKGWFGIESPSTVMAEVGVNLMEGLAEGIEAGSSLAVAAMAGAGQEILDASNSFADRLKLAWMNAADEIGKAFESMTVSIGNMFLAGEGDWRQILVSFLSQAINSILVAAVGAMGIAELVSQAMAQMWNPAGWLVIGGLLIALAAIRNKLARDLAVDPDPGPSPGPGPGGGSGGGSGGSSGGRQISEITGPTRDLLVDLLSPLANFGQIVAPIQDIRDILEQRLPNFNAFGLEFAAAGAGAMSPAVVIENLNVTAPTTGVDDISRASIDQIEKALAGRIAIGQRGRGKRW